MRIFLFFTLHPKIPPKSYPQEVLWKTLKIYFFVLDFLLAHVIITTTRHDGGNNLWSKNVKGVDTHGLREYPQTPNNAHTAKAHSGTVRGCAHDQGVEDNP